MHEPVVTLTDFALALEATLFALWARGPLRGVVVLFFASLAAAAALGGLVHGFFPEPGGPGERWLWPAALLAIGVTAFACWCIGAAIVWPEHMARRVRGAAALLLALYAVAVVWLTRSFTLAVVHYLPAVLALLVAFLVAWRREGSRAAVTGAAGVALTLLAAGVQQAGLTVHPRWFDHNALYHVLQMLALVGIHRGLRNRAVCTHAVGTDSVCTHAA